MATAHRRVAPGRHSWRRLRAPLDANHCIAQGRARDADLVEADFRVEVELRELGNERLERGLFLWRRASGCSRQVAIEVDAVEFGAYEALGRHDAGFEIRVVEAARDRFEPQHARLKMRFERDLQ